MGKQYISTANSGNAHKSDILGVAICQPLTATVSSDGFLKLWSNQIPEASNPKEKVTEILVDPIGLHHVSIYENTINAIKFIIVATTSFGGNIYFKQVIGTEVKSLKLLEQSEKDSFWAIEFWKDPESKHDYFIATQSNGSTKIYELLINAETSEISLQHYNTITPKSTSFANSLSVSPVEKKLAVGYANGDVILYDLDSTRPIYAFHSTDLLAVSANGTSTASMPRAIKFSPAGLLLAVARDSGSSGSVSLYDVKFGENVGALTAPSHSASTSVGGFAHSGWIIDIDFNEDGSLLATGGFDANVRIWNIETREREATINISRTDLDDDSQNDEDGMDASVVSGVKFIKKGVRGSSTGTNDGLAVVSFDRGIRWYREAGGI